MLIMLLVTLALGACGGTETAEDETQPQIRIGNVLYPPYTYYDINGNFTGIDVELAREACRRLGYQPVFTALRKGYADAIVGHESALAIYTSDYPDQYRCLHMSINSSEMGVAFSKDADAGLVDALTEVLREMAEDGTAEEQTDEEMLEQYAGYQYLTGIFVLDEALYLAASVDDSTGEAAGLLEKILEDGNVQSILEHPEKVYADQITMGETTYDYAVVARAEGRGAVVCYADATRLLNDKNELFLRHCWRECSFGKMR